MNKEAFLTQAQKAIHAIGIVLVLASIIFIYGWLQTGDPDCILENGLFAQARFCGKEYVDQPAESPAWLIWTSLAALVFGIFCMRYSLRKFP